MVIRASFSESATDTIIIFVHAFISYIKFIAVFVYSHLDIHITMNAFIY